MSSIARLVIDDQNPWPGLGAFDEAAQQFFNGRGNETAELRRLVLNASLTVLFGASGLGKTSLIQAGLFPSSRKQHFLPIYVRLDFSDKTGPLIEQIKFAFQQQVRAHGVDAPPFGERESLWQYLHRSELELWSPRNQLLTPLFVFDQFEEVFTVGAENAAATRRLRADLADLIENRVPDTVAKAVRADEAAAADLALDSQRYRVVLSFREDFLPAVESWKRDLPSILRNRLRLLPMSQERAFEAVHQTAPKLVDETLAHEIVQFVAAAHEDENGKGHETAAETAELAVEPALLSLVCHGLNEKRKAQGKAAFDKELLTGSKQSIISDYYQGAVGDLPRRVQDFIGNELITERGFRKPCDVDDARSKHGVTDQQLRLLVDRRLLRIEPQRGSERVELTHDLLTGVVRERRDRTRTWRRRRRIFKSVAIVMALMLAAGITLYYNRREAAEWAAAQAKEKERIRDETNLSKARINEREKVLRQRAEIEHALRQKAVDFQILATARQLASQSDGLKARDSRIEVSALLAIESLKRKPLPEGIQALRAPMALLHRPLWTKEAKRPKSREEENNDEESEPEVEPPSPVLQFSANGQYLAQVSVDAKLHVFQAASGRELPTPSLSEKPDSLAWDGNQLYLLAASQTQNLAAVVYAISLTGGATKEVLRKPCLGLCLLTPSGKYLMLDPREEGALAQLYPLAGGRPMLVEKGGRILGTGQDARLFVRETERHEDRLSITDREAHPIAEIDGDSSPRLFDIGGPSGYLAFTGRDRVIRIYQMQPEFKQVGQVISPVNPVTIALSPKGRLIAIADEEGGVRLLDWVVQGRRGAWSQSSEVVAIAFSPDGQSVASMDSTGELHIIPLEEAPLGGSRGASAARNRLSLALNLRAGTTFAASFDPSERFLFVRRPNFSQLFDAARGTEVRFGVGNDSVIVISEEGRYAAASSRSLELQITDLTTNSTTTLKGSGRVMALSPGAKYLAVRQGSVNRGGQPMGPIRIATVSTRSFSGLPKGTSSPTFSPDGRWLFLRHAGTAMLVRCGAWTVTHEWEFDWPGMTALFSRDGRFLFVRGLGRARGSDQQPTRNYLFIDTASLRDRTFSVLERADITAARFSSDGRFLGVAARDRSVRIFELPSGKLVTQISSDFAVTSIVFSHSPHYLGLASGSSSPRIYQLPGGVEVTRAGLQEKERLLAFHFAEDERSLILASTSLGSVEDATDKSQEVSIERQYLFSEDLIREGCARVSRNLTWEEWKSYLPDYPYEKTCLDLPGPGKQR